MFYDEINQFQTYLDDQSLTRLKDYKYRSVDLSPTTKYILKYWWEWVASWMPIWLAPNLITLIGLAFIVLNVITVVIYDPDLKTEIHSWFYFSFTLGLFIYQTLDNVDGKQARKTGTSSPLGELFDHGIDSLNCVLGGLVQCAAVGTGHSWYSVFVVVVACWPMYLGVLYLGYINGPTEGLLIAMAILFNAGLNGIQFWRIPLAEVIVLPRSIVDFFSYFDHQLRVMDLFVLFVLFALVAGHAPFCVYNTWKAIQFNNTLPPSKQDPRLKSMTQALFRLLPLLIFTLSSVGWITSPYSNLLKNQKMIEFSLMLCLIFGRISTRMILSHLTKSVFPFLSMMMLPLIGGLILINLPIIGLPKLLSPFGELIYLRLGFFISFIGYLNESKKTIGKFCERLKIQCLSISYKEEKRLS